MSDEKKPVFKPGDGVRRVGSARVLTVRRVEEDDDGNTVIFTAGGSSYYEHLVVLVRSAPKIEIGTQLRFASEEEAFDCAMLFDQVYTVSKTDSFGEEPPVTILVKWDFDGINREEWVYPWHFVMAENKSFKVAPWTQTHEERLEEFRRGIRNAGDNWLQGLV